MINTIIETFCPVTRVRNNFVGEEQHTFMHR